MGRGVFYNRYINCYSISVAVLLLITFSACRSTKHLSPQQNLLWQNKLILTSDKVMPNKGEIKDNLDRIIIQKPNSNYLGIMPFKVPMKLWRYNRRYRKFSTRPDSLLPKSVERPTIFDSTSMPRTVQNMKTYLFNQGYFYASVSDTVIYKGKKAYTTYKVNAGYNYLINKIIYKIDDSSISKIVTSNENATILKKGKEFAYSMLEEERSRITNLVANQGYRRFNLENISFKLDTMDKSIFKVAGSPFENVVNFVSQNKSNKKKTLDVVIIIRKTDDTLSYNKYRISRVNVYPDYKGNGTFSTFGMVTKRINGIDFYYNKYYVNAHVLHEHIFLNPGELYSKKNEDKTTTKLGELGIFQYIRVQFRENRKTRDSLECNIYLNRTKKHDFSTNYEISNGTTYALGNSVSLNYRNKNFMKGANLLSIGINGGLESFYNDDIAEDVYRRFRILTRYYGVNASLDFPKFLAPIASSLFSNTNLPHTIIGGGENVIDRVNYFRLVNSSANFAYSWHQSDTKTWGLTPAFINNIRLPFTTDSFDNLLDSNEYLANSYKQTFIHGENISFKYDNSGRKKGSSHSYIRLAFEEAGGILNAVNTVGDALNSIYKLEFAQYTKFDFDLRHYITLNHSNLALRFYGGVGLPSGNSPTLPYIKQYFAGGPYSLRGWRIRTLGPGSFLNPEKRQLNQIDRTGDIKLEMNSEYRFPIAPLFAGAIKMNGAFFADAGNIWLASKTDAYPGGEFAFNKLEQDIAVDVGMGTRLDIASFLTFRVDIAMPVKKPYIMTKSGWVVKDIDFSNPTWRTDNLILNISIGYPF